MPSGDEAWQRQAAAPMGLQKTFRQRGRPRKPEACDPPRAAEDAQAQRRRPDQKPTRRHRRN